MSFLKRNPQQQQRSKRKREQLTGAREWSSTLREARRAVLPAPGAPTTSWPKQSSGNARSVAAPDAVDAIAAIAVSFSPPSKCCARTRMRLGETGNNNNAAMMRRVVARRPALCRPLWRVSAPLSRTVVPRRTLANAPAPKRPAAVNTQASLVSLLRG